MPEVAPAPKVIPGWMAPTAKTRVALGGAAGAQVRVELPQDFPSDKIKVWADGGAGGLAGTAGKPGRGGQSKGCLVYRADGGDKGRPGLEGQPGPAGPAGTVTIQRL